MFLMCLGLIINLGLLWEYPASIYQVSQYPSIGDLLNTCIPLHQSLHAIQVRPYLKTITSAITSNCNSTKIAIFLLEKGGIENIKFDLIKLKWGTQEVNIFLKHLINLNEWKVSSQSVFLMHYIQTSSSEKYCTRVVFV